MKKRIILMTGIFAIAVGAAFASKSSIGGDKIYENAAGCQEVTSCTTTNTGNDCLEVADGYNVSNCTGTLFHAYERP